MEGRQLRQGHEEDTEDGHEHVQLDGAARVSDKVDGLQ
jgi:hypothetical protein